MEEPTASQMPDSVHSNNQWGIKGDPSLIEDSFIKELVYGSRTVK
ncbi:hypothetical protein [Virgibacillus proomii]|nr:hypothetical protein [Virgibacillus proomii]